MDERPWHRFYDAGVPRSIDYQRWTLPELLERTAERFPDRLAIVFRNARLTWLELLGEVRRLATGLQRLGVTKGTRVAIQLPNLPQTVVAFYAVQYLGAVAVMTNPLYVARELEHQWGDAGCEVAIVTDFLFAARIAALRARLPVREYVVARIPDYLRAPLRWIAPFALRRRRPLPLWAPIEPGDGVHLYRDLVRLTVSEPMELAPRWEDLAALQYTGGTTGVSKGAMLTHANLSTNVQQVDAWVGGEHGVEVVLVAIPLFHVYGLTACMNACVLSGSTMVLMPDPRDVAGIVGAIERHRVTLFPSVPALFNAIAAQPGIGRRQLGSLVRCVSGSAPIPAAVQRRFEEQSGSVIVEGFGLTETSPVTHNNPLVNPRKIGSIGLPMPDTDARIVSLEEPRCDLGVGEEGELAIRGPQVMAGYWQRPEETSAILRDGWLYTGDLARMDAEGYFEIVGRVKDMILCSGYNVYPDEIDEVLMAHPAVLESGTIGVPDEVRGETVKSFIVPRPGASPTVDELVRHCRENLAAYKVPRQIEFLPELPKSSVLKVLRRELRARP